MSCIVPYNEYIFASPINGYSTATKHLINKKSKAMRKTFATTAFIFGYFTLMTTLGVIASVPVSVHKNAKESVRREIIRNIACPDFISTNSELNKVKAIVEVDEAGNVNVSEINSGNPELKDYVIKQLQHMKVSSKGGPEKFVLIINFKVA